MFGWCGEGAPDSAMRYQLVLQFTGDTLVDYDVMIALEDRLSDDLGHSAQGRRSRLRLARDEYLHFYFRPTSYFLARPTGVAARVLSAVSHSGLSSG